MARLAIERIVLGPKREGHGYGVLAASEGLALSPAALDVLMDFNLRIGEHIRPDRPVHAGFQFSYAPDRELWFVCETRHMGRAGPNPLIQTWGLVLARPQLDAVDYRLHALLAFNPVPDEPAKLGDALAAITVETRSVKATVIGSPPGLGLVDVLVARPSPLRLGVGGQLDALGTLGELLDELGAPARAEISFITGPVPVFPWDLLCYDRELWSDYRVADAVAFDERGASGGGEPSEADRVWHRLRLALDARNRPLAMGLNRHVSSTARESAAERVGRVISAFLDEIPLEHARTAAMSSLIEAAADLPLESDRAAVGQGLVRTLESLFSRGQAVGADLVEYVRLQEPLTERLGAPPLLLTRLAAERGGALLVDAATIDRLDQSIVVNFASELLTAIPRTSPTLGAVAALLDKALAADSRERAPHSLMLALLDEVLTRAPAAQAHEAEADAVERAIEAVGGFVARKPRTSGDIAAVAARKRAIEDLCGRHVSWNRWRRDLNAIGLSKTRKDSRLGGFFGFTAWWLSRHDLKSTAL